MKPFCRQWVSKSSCVKKETVAVDILSLDIHIHFCNFSNKFIQSITIVRKPTDAKIKIKQNLRRSKRHRIKTNVPRDSFSNTMYEYQVNCEWKNNPAIAKVIFRKARPIHFHKKQLLFARSNKTNWAFQELKSACHFLTQAICTCCH